MNTKPLTVECKVHFQRTGPKKEIQPGPKVQNSVPGRVPRIARLMALAIKFDGLIRTGKIKDYAELARLGHITRARATQIMNLLMLAPSIQEEILHLPLVESGRAPVILMDLQAIAQKADWKKQRQLWRELVAME
jgi:hypothetical protein